MGGSTPSLNGSGAGGGFVLEDRNGSGSGGGFVLEERTSNDNVEDLREENPLHQTCTTLEDFVMESVSEASEEAHLEDNRAVGLASDFTACDEYNKDFCSLSPDSPCEGMMVESMVVPIPGMMILQDVLTDDD